MARHESIRYRGIKFYRYPESKYQPHRRYWNPGIGDRQRGVDYLHREVWRDANGRQEIPKGHHVHHIDGDYDNNRPDNLELLSADDHYAHHREERRNDPVWLAKMRENVSKAIAAAPEWHASDEGLEWHAEHWHESLGKSFKNREGKCDQCGEAYMVWSSNDLARFCSNACKSAWRRGSGVDDVQRECDWCGTGFTINKYIKRTTCCRACTTERNRSDRRAA